MIFWNFIRALSKKTSLFGWRSQKGFIHVQKGTFSQKTFWKTFESLSQSFSRVFSKLILTSPEEHFEEKLIFSRTLSEKFYAAFVKTEFYVFRGTFWANSLVKTFDFWDSFGLWAENFRSGCHFILSVQRNTIVEHFFLKFSQLTQPELANYREKVYTLRGWFSFRNIHY